MSGTNTNFQQCAQLEVENKFQHADRDTLGSLMTLQKTLQEGLFGHNFNNIQSSIQKLKDFCNWNEEAIRDEQREFAAAITGIHTYPNCWKPWKSKHAEAMNRKLADLSKEELLELKYEWIDQLHFMFNIALAIGLDSEQVYNLYFAKNKHNIERQQRPEGY